MVFIPTSETTVSNSEQPNITIISTAAFFKLYLCSSDIWANSTKLAEASDLSNVSSKYH